MRLRFLFFKHLHPDCRLLLDRHGLGNLDARLLHRLRGIGIVQLMFLLLSDDDLFHLLLHAHLHLWLRLLFLRLLHLFRLHDYRSA